MDLDEHNIEVEKPDNTYNKDKYMDIEILEKAREYGTLVTKDKLMRVIARSEGIAVEDYKNDKVNEVYKGHTEVFCEDGQIDDIYNTGELEMEHDHFTENQFVNIKNGQQSALTLYQDGKLRLIADKMVHGIQGKNKEQVYALNALMSKNIELVTLTGQAGTGKTLCAIASALEQVLELERYKKFNVARPIKIMGDNDLGFMPGDKDEKLDLFMQPVFDSIEFLYNTNPREIITELKDRNKFNMESLGHIRGRTLQNQFILIDEAQNTNIHEISTILTRIGKGSKVVLTGDINQIDLYYLDRQSNGLSYVVNNFKGQDNFCHINLEKSERSKLARQSAKLL